MPTQKIFYNSFIFWLIKLYTLDRIRHLELVFDPSIVEKREFLNRKDDLNILFPLFTQSILLGE